MNTILINSHRRSGTHFLIDSLRLNINQAIFPTHRGLTADFNIGLLYSKKERIYHIFKKFIDSDNLIIIKSHLIPGESDIANPADKHEELIKKIHRESRKLYIYRDGKETLSSLYRFLKPKIPFGDFLRSVNDHIIHEIRNEEEFDKDRVTYWAYHVASWIGESDVYSISYDQLKNNYEKTVSGILDRYNFPVPDKIIKPRMPKNARMHTLLRKISQYGLLPLPENSSIRPGKKKHSIPTNYFTHQKDLQFFEDYSGSVKNIVC